jgi:hypothetical protein
VQKRADLRSFHARYKNECSQMSTATHTDEARSTNPDLPRPEEIAEQLRSLLASPTFHGSKRCQQFLEYVCEKSLAGEIGALKERSIALDVFGRHLDEEGHAEDTIVRVSAREVRKRLAQYYVTPEGAASAILIELPSGSYAPRFHYARLPEPKVMQPAEAVPQPAVPNRRRLFLVAGVCIAAVLAVTVAVVRWSTTDPRAAAFQSFWAPVFHSSQPLLVGVGHPIVYQPSHRAAMLSAKRREPFSPFPVQRPIDVPPDELTGADMIPVFNQYVGFGDMVAANEVSQMLALRSRTVRLMLASSIPFADLKQSQTYLIGSVSNHWTMELGEGWRYRFGWTAEQQPEFYDSLPGQKREWTIPSQDDGSTSDDYSMICRIHNSPTGMLLIVSAGIKQFGTEAAGRILADPVALGTILNKLPPGWEGKNLQVILHMKVIGNTPAQPELVASHVW